MDARDHLDWVLAKLVDCDAAFKQLHSEQHLIDVCVRWDSKSGHGGPTISPIQMRRLAELEIELWFDIYFDGDGDEEGEQDEAQQPPLAALTLAALLTAGAAQAAVAVFAGSFS